MQLKNNNTIFNYENKKMEETSLIKQEFEDLRIYAII
jgi:hypothetical protein